MAREVFLTRYKHIDIDMIKNSIPLRIKCPNPDCQKIYTLFVKDFNQGIHCILGQACPFCKRFIRESDDPKYLLVDLQKIKEMMKGEDKEKKK